LYRQLRPRPNGLPKEQVVANQRTRVFGAMIESVSVRGYEATSVAELCRLAGISKRTFYEQFENKEACYLAALDRVVGCARTRVHDAQGSRGEWGAEVRVGVEELVRGVVDQPRAAGLVLCALDGAGPGAEACGGRVRLELERMIAEGFERASYGVGLPAVLVKAIGFGVQRVLRWGLLEGGCEPDVLARELAGWVSSFAPGALAVLPAAGSMNGDGGVVSCSLVRARLGRERARMLRAAAEIVAAEGYSRLDVEGITGRAGVREAVFWASYESAGGCFLDAVDLVGFEALMSAAKASRAAGEGLVGVCRGIAALLGQIAGDPVLRGVLFLELPAAGVAALERRERLLRCFEDLLGRSAAPPRRPSEVALEASIGAVWGVVHEHVVQGAAHVLPGLAPHMAYVALAPVVGSDAAVETVLAAGH
jgi:AcrR family transcriptional regulator